MDNNSTREAANVLRSLRYYMCNQVSMSSHWLGTLRIGRQQRCSQVGSAQKNPISSIPPHCHILISLEFNVIVTLLNVMYVCQQKKQRKAPREQCGVFSERSYSEKVYAAFIGASRLTSSRYIIYPYKNAMIINKYNCLGFALA